jgi:NAD(P)H-dependent FMN reductase
MYKVKIISSTVRPGRKGPLIAQWIAEQAKAYGNFEVETLDLGEIGLPLMNEANHPSMRKYEHEHTKKWSNKIEEADAFIFVTAEYDNSYPAPLKNALEYLLFEWKYKPSGIVSYSLTPFGGVRAVANLKQDLVYFNNMPVAELVNIPVYSQYIKDDDVFAGDEKLTGSTKTMLNELLRWTKGMKAIRENN